MTQIRLKTYDKQAAFDLVVRHLASLPHAAMSAHGCSYLTATGLRCAAGALMKCSDAELRPFAEQGSFIGLVNEDADPLILGLDEDFECFVQDLQTLHDASGPRSPGGNFIEVDHITYPNIWADGGNGRFQGWDALRAFAEANGLSSAVVDEVAP